MLRPNVVILIFSAALDLPISALRSALSDNRKRLLSVMIVSLALILKVSSVCFSPEFILGVSTVCDHEGAVLQSSTTAGVSQKGRLGFMFNKPFGLSGPGG